MSITRNGRLRRATERKDWDKVKIIEAQIKTANDNPVGEGCDRCPEDSLAACFGDKCATKCCGTNEGEYKPTQVVPVSPERPKMQRGGRKTRRKRRKKRRKSRKMRKKTKRRRKRRRKKSKKVRRK